MQLVTTATSTSTDLASRAVGAALGVLFADGDELTHLRASGAGVLPLSPNYSICADDTYLVLPDDIGDEIVDIMRDGDHALLAEALDEGLVCCGHIQHARGGCPVLSADAVKGARALLEARLAYAAMLHPSREAAPLRQINALPHLQCTMLSALLDEAGLSAVLTQDEHLGASWQVPDDSPALAQIDPTYVWSRRTGPGEVGIELALFVEEGELIALLRPLKLRLG